MILRDKKKKLKKGETKTVIKFAFLPKHIPNTYDEYGEWFWWEKYVVTYRYDDLYSCWYKFRFKFKLGWKKSETKRVNQAMLDKLST